MDLGIANQLALVTGAARGIGAATARLLRAEGARVAGWDLHPDEFSSTSSLDLFLKVDLTDAEQVRRAWSESEQKLGPIGILVHAAAIGSGHFGFPFTNVPLMAWARVLEVNVIGMANIAQVAGPAMQDRKSGAMVFLASVAGQIGSQTDPPYSASKAANINFAQCLAKDLAPSGVRVNTVCPGMVRTTLNESVWKAWHDQQAPENQKSYDVWANEKVQKVIPLQRWQTPDDVAAMIVFLCSSRASEITGQTINVDGGCVMHW